MEKKTFLAKNSQAIGRLQSSSVLKPGSRIFSADCFIKVLLMMHEEERLANTLTPEIIKPCTRIKVSGKIEDHVSSV